MSPITSKKKTPIPRNRKNPPQNWKKKKGRILRGGEGENLTYLSTRTRLDKKKRLPKKRTPIQGGVKKTKEGEVDIGTQPPPFSD